MLDGSEVSYRKRMTSESNESTTQEHGKLMNLEARGMSTGCTRGVSP
jgi:hypothetical protein